MTLKLCVCALLEMRTTLSFVVAVLEVGHLRTPSKLRLITKGYLAQQYALTYPKKLSHLILRGTAPSYHRKLSLLIFKSLSLIVVETRKRHCRFLNDGSTKLPVSP
jgi:pimeloyl-ACP methyl ester carboxylesterase